MEPKLETTEDPAAVPPQKRNWCMLSTAESVQNEVLSVTAILETVVAVPLYWGLALWVGMLLPLLVSIAVAPLVLLRSEQSVALGLQWLRRFDLAAKEEDPDLSPVKQGTLWVLAVVSATITLYFVWLVFRHTSLGIGWPAGQQIAMIIVIIVAATAIFNIILLCLATTISVIIPDALAIFDILYHESGWRRVNILPYILGVLIGIPLGLFLASLAIRIVATLAHLRSGVAALPQNFRRLIFCMSPAQMPELIPGLETSDSFFSFHNMRRELVLSETRSGVRITKEVMFGVWGLIMFVPAWLYRITLKSTAWFWWPLAFLGGDLRQARSPALFHWKVIGRLSAKARFALSFTSLLAFAAVNLFLDGAMFQRNPLLTPLGYLLLFDWTLRSWQVCAVAGAVLSIALVFLANDVSGEYRIAQDTRDNKLLRIAERRFGWLERLARLRLLLFLLFWGLVGMHAMLYINSQRCWFSLSPTLQSWAQEIYGDRLPRNNCASLHAYP